MDLLLPLEDLRELPLLLHGLLRRPLLGRRRLPHALRLLLQPLLLLPAPLRLALRLPALLRGMGPSRASP